MFVFKVGIEARLDNFKINFITKPESPNPWEVRLGLLLLLLLFSIKGIQPPLPWKDCLRTLSSVSDLEWSRNADSKHKAVLKNLDLLKQVVSECVWSSK